MVTFPRFPIGGIVLLVFSWNEEIVSIHLQKEEEATASFF
jgi:hypothetical protein